MYKFLILFLICLGLVSAAVMINEDEEISGVDIEIPVSPFDNATAFVNSSHFADIWITAEGNMDDVLDLYSTLDNKYLNLSGTNANQDIDVNPYDFNASVINALTEFVSDTLKSLSIPANFLDMSGAVWTLNGAGFQADPIQDGSGASMSGGHLTALDLLDGTFALIMGADPWDADVGIRANNFHLDDNEKYYAGTADDSSIYYDGVDLIIDPQEVGSGGVSVLGDINTTGNVGIGGTSDTQAHLMLTDSGDVEIMFDSTPDDPMVVGWDESSNSFIWHRWYLRNAAYRNLGSFGDLMVLSQSGDLQLNPDGFSGGGRLIQKSKATSGGGLQNIFSAALELASGSGQVGDGLEYLFRIENGAGGIHDAAEWNVLWVDPTAGSEDSTTIFRNMVAGSMKDILNISASGVKTIYNITTTGNITGNQIYGEMWFHNDTASGQAVVITAQNNWYNITGFNQTTNASQTLNGFTFNTPEQYLEVHINGRYDCSFDISAGNSGNNQEYQFAVAVNDVPQQNTIAHRKIGAAGDVGNAGERGFVDLVDGDILTVMVSNRDGTTNLETHSSGLNCIRIGD